MTTPRVWRDLEFNSLSSVKQKRNFRRSLKSENAATSDEQTAQDLHEPVLLTEVLQYLEPETGGFFVDCTLGLGGHTAAILQASDSARVLGIDRDAAALAKAGERLQTFGERFRAVHANYKEIGAILNGERATGILADLGVSSWQLDDASRGFSFRFDAALDMRMNAGSTEATAADLLKTLSEEEIANVIYEYGEERFSRRIARNIVAKREAGEPVETTMQLAGIVERSVKRDFKNKIHPATRTFQALRIAVNRELNGLDDFLKTAIENLETNGKLAVISFHSLEDRIVKTTFRRLSGVCECPPRLPVCQCGAIAEVEILTRRPITASDAETARNPRSRSAKLRVCRKLS